MKKLDDNGEPLPKGVTHRADGRYCYRKTEKGKNPTCVYGKSVEEVVFKANNPNEQFFVDEKRVDRKFGYFDFFEKLKIIYFTHGYFVGYMDCREGRDFDANQGYSDLKAPLSNSKTRKAADVFEFVDFVKREVPEIYSELIKEYRRRSK